MKLSAKDIATIVAALACAAAAGSSQERNPAGGGNGAGDELRSRSAGLRPPLAGAVVRPLVSFVGADTRIAERRCQRLDHQHDWELFWLKHEGKAGRPEDYNQYRRTGAPAIDFDQCMVIAVTESPGALNAGITAVSINETDEQITFDYDDMFYQAQEGTSAPGNAYGYFVLPRSTKPVVVRHNVQEGHTRYTGGPPVWSEVARFDALE